MNLDQQALQKASEKFRLRLLPITPLPADARPPMSFSQQSLWFLAQLEPNNSYYHSNQIFELSGPLRVDALKKALNALILRHEPLRTGFSVQDGQPEAVIHAAEEIKVHFRSYENIDPQKQKILIEQQLQQWFHLPFNLAEGQLLRIGLLQLNEQHHLLALFIHHIAADGWSLGIMERDLAALYQAYANHPPTQPALPELPIRYVDYAYWQRHNLDQCNLDQSELLDYWRERLKSIPDGMPLTTDRPRPIRPSFRGAHQQFDFDNELTQQIDKLAQTTGNTRFMVLLAAFQAWIGRYSGQSDIVVASPVAGRQQLQLKNLMGVFVNTLVLRTKLTQELTFQNLLIQTRKDTLNDFKHQNLPFAVLVEQLNPERSRDRNPLAQIAFIYQNTPQAKTDWGQLKVKYWPQVVETLRFDIEVHAIPSKRGFRFVWIYSQDLWDSQSITRMSDHFHALLQGLLRSPQASIYEPPMLKAEEYQRLRMWNDQAFNKTPNKTIEYQSVISLFEKQAMKFPTEIALHYAENCLSYGDLNQCANQVARRLIASGVGPEIPVGLCLERSLEMLIGVLAIFKSGGIYVPINPNDPISRLKFILKDTGIKRVLTQQSLIEKHARAIPNCIFINLNSISLSKRTTSSAQQSNPNIQIHPAQAAYILYTSGSSGQPKGVVMPHRALHNLITWHHQTKRLKQSAATLQFAALTFDVSLQEIFVTLTQGGSLWVVSDSIRLNPNKILSFLQQNLIERLFIPVVILNRLAEIAAPTDLPKLRDVITAGEALEITTPIRNFFSAHRCRLHNHYGPTETHVVSSFLLPKKSSEWPTRPAIGRPILNTQIYILDVNHRLLPIDVPGELYIGGAGLGEHYLNIPEHTGSGFVILSGEQLGLNHNQAVRLYQTGDKALWRDNGQLEFLGRVDRQIKLRGFRIEPGEIETRLCTFPSIREAVVVLQQKNQQAPYLTAYLLADNQVPPENSEIRRVLATHLPEYMIPTAFVILDALPLTSSGKIDYSALSIPEQKQDKLASTYCVPRSPLEIQLGEIWQANLHLNEPPGIYDNFFDLGGHSLLSAQLITQIEQTFDCNLPLHDFFSSPTIAGLTDILGKFQDGSANMASTYAQATKNSTLTLPSRRWPLPHFLHQKLFSYIGSWHGTRVNSDSLIIGHNCNAEKTPLFWIFQGEQEWKQLAKYLGSERPLYGMRSGYLFMEYNEDNIQSLALAYLEEILQLCPDGPLFIGGNCQAGVIAEAVAQHLWRRRRQIPLLFLMEWSFPFQTYLGPTALLFGEESQIANPKLRLFKQPELAWERYFRQHQIKYIPGSHGHFWLEPYIQKLAGILQNLMDEASKKPQYHFSGKPLGAEIIASDIPTRMPRDTDISLSVTIRNLSAMNWNKGIALANRWFKDKGQLLSSIDAGAILPTMEPGQSIIVNLSIRTPNQTGHVELHLLLLDEGVRWYEDEQDILKLFIELE